jgi:hypothetical protein
MRDFAFVGRLTALTALSALTALAACGGKPAAAPASTTTAGTEAAAAKATVVSFAVDPESHTVDKVGGTDGAFHADGANDIVFAAQIDGPFKALFLVETDETGKSAHDFGADTLVGTQQAPDELGGILEQGKFTSGIAVFENGKLVNEGNGSLGDKGVGPGRHALKLYINEDPRLGKTGHIQLLVLAVDGTLVKGPVIPY